MLACGCLGSGTLLIHSDGGVLLARLNSWVKAELAHSKHLVAAGLWSLIFRVAGIAATFVAGVVLARYLGPEALGLYGITVAIALVLSVVAQAGLPTLATREIAVAISREDWSGVRGAVQGFGGFVLGASLALGIALAAISKACPQVFGPQAESYTWGAILVPLFALTVLVGAELRALGSLVVGQSLDTLIRPLALIALCLVAHTFLGSLTSSAAIILSAAAALVGVTFGCVWLGVRLPHQIRAVSPRYNRRDWQRSAAPLALVDWLRQIDATYGILLVGIFCSDLDAGYFRLAFSVLVCVAAPLSIFHQVLGPTIARLIAGEEMASLQRLLRQAALLMTGIMLLEFVIIALAARPIISIIFGARYSDAAVPLLFLTGAQVVNALFGASWMMLAMGSGEKPLTASFLASVLTSIVAAVALGATWGMTGIAAASIVGALVQSVVSWRYAKRIYDVDGSIFSIISK